MDENGNRYIDIGGKNYLLTEGLYELLTSKEPDLENIPGNDIAMYSRILVDTNTMYVNNDPKSSKLKSKDDPKVTKSAKWIDVIKPRWDKLQKEKNLKKEKKGSGVKKVVIHCDPNALLERLDLLMASKAAGNTGVRNELVSVCDELKRQGVFDSKSYKKIMSIL